MVSHALRKSSLHNSQLLRPTCSLQAKNTFSLCCNTSDSLIMPSMICICAEKLEGIQAYIRGYANYGLVQQNTWKYPDLVLEFKSRLSIRACPFQLSFNFALQNLKFRSVVQTLHCANSLILKCTSSKGNKEVPK